MSQRWNTTESVSTSGGVSDKFRKNFGDSIEAICDEGARFKSLPDARTASADSLNQAINAPGEATSVRIADITSDIQTPQRDGQVRGSVALDLPLQQLGEHTTKLKCTLHLAETTRQKMERLPGGGSRLTPLLIISFDNPVDNPIGGYMYAWLIIRTVLIIRLTPPS